LALLFSLESSAVLANLHFPKCLYGSFFNALCKRCSFSFVITSRFFLDGAFYAAPAFDRSMKASKSARSNRRRFPKVTDGIFLPQAIVRTNQMVAPKYSAAARTFNSRGVMGAAVTGFFFVAAVIAGLLQGQPGVTPTLLLNRFIGLFFAGVS
jgi:hypothetical protein